MEIQKKLLNYISKWQKWKNLMNLSLWEQILMMELKIFVKKLLN